MRFLTAIMATAALTLIDTSAQAAGEVNGCKDYDVFILRHLEKDNDGTKDPSLSQLGKLNAKKLAELTVFSNINHAFYTPYKRTYETLEFIDAEKSVYDPSQTQQLVRKIKDKHCGETVVIAGHSNTVPGLVTAFGGSFTVSYAGQNLSYTPDISLDENDYGSIFRVTFHNERLHQQLYQLNPKGQRKLQLRK